MSPKPLTDQERMALKREQEMNDLRVLLAQPEGKRFFRRMFGAGLMEQDAFTGNSNTFYNLGMRAVVLKYWNDVKTADVGAFIEILTGDK